MDRLTQHTIAETAVKRWSLLSGRIPIIPWYIAARNAVKEKPARNKTAKILKKDVLLKTQARKKSEAAAYASIPVS